MIGHGIVHRIGVPFFSRIYGLAEMELQAKSVIIFFHRWVLSYMPPSEHA